jgi:hypothetical protein
MAKAVRCLNCGQMSGKHSFPGFHCPDHTNKGAFLADQTMKSDIGTPIRKRLLDALGWQGGTVADALAEVRRLRGTVNGRRCLRNGKYLIAGELNLEKYDGNGEAFLFSEKQCHSLANLGFEVEPHHGAWD